MRCVSATICAPARGIACVSRRSPSTKCSAPSSGGWPVGRRPASVMSPVVVDPSVPTQLLARFRVALGWVFAPLVLIAAEPTAGSIAVGMSIAAAGEVLRIWSAGHLNKAREVTSSGPYRWFAHPLYVGSTVMGAGLGIASHSVVVIALIGLYLV